MTKKKHNQSQEPQISITRSTGLGRDLLKSLNGPDLKNFQVDLEKDDKTYTPIGFNSVSIESSAGNVPKEWGITDPRVANLQVEIIGKTSERISGLQLLGHIEAADRG